MFSSVSCCPCQQLGTLMQYSFTQAGQSLADNETLVSSFGCFPEGRKRQGMGGGSRLQSLNSSTILVDSIQICSTPAFLHGRYIKSTAKKYASGTHQTMAPRPNHMPTWSGTTTKVKITRNSKAARQEMDVAAGVRILVGVMDLSLMHKTLFFH